MAIGERRRFVFHYSTHPRRRRKERPHLGGRGIDFAPKTGYNIHKEYDKRHASLTEIRMITITANQLKIEGVSGIARAMEASEEVIISVRGRPRYVVMDIETYERLRESEIEAAWMQARREMEEGKARVETADEHMARVLAELEAEDDV